MTLVCLELPGLMRLNCNSLAIENTVMLLGCLSASTAGNLVKVKGIMNKEKDRF